MAYRYIALVHPPAPENARATRMMTLRLREHGLARRVEVGDVTVFATSSTPVLQIADGILLGHVFNRSGNPLAADASALAASRSRGQLRSHLMEQCWGDYILIQPSDDRRSITVTRDPSPSGGFPCVYATFGETHFFASDAQLPEDLGLYQHSIDWDHIAHRLTYPALKTARTGFRDLRELLPGTSLQLRGSARSFSSTWSPWNFVAADRRHVDPAAAAREVGAVVRTVIDTWAKTDQAIVLELSGGLDSSIVGTALQGTNARVACATLVTPLPGADERRYAALIANALGVPLHSELLEVDAARYDFVPSPHPLTPRIGALQFAIDATMRRVADRQQATSYFSGGGGDTVFCFLKTASPAADAFRERGVQGGLAAIGDLSQLHRCTHWTAAWLTLRKLLRAPKPPCRMDTMFLSANAPPAAREDHPWFDAPPHALPGDRERIFDLAGTQIFRDCLPRGTERFLRMPLLSQPVIEACLKAPSWMWIANGHNRAVARAAFADGLPADVLNRRSKGTFMGYLGAVYGRHRLHIRDFLLDGQLSSRGLLEKDALARFIDRPLEPRDRTFTRVIDLCTVENWVRHHA